MTVRPTAHGQLAAIAVAVSLAGCGATPPQAPRKAAMRLSVATSGISTACGLAYQVTAFPGPHRGELVTLEVTAAASARKLASVYARNPAWIYQGETVGQIVQDAAAMLHACGLNQAERALLRATSP